MARLGVLLVSVPYTLATWEEEQFNQCDQNKLCFVVGSCENGESESDKKLKKLDVDVYLASMSNCSLVVLIRPYKKETALVDVFSTLDNRKEFTLNYDGTDIANCTVQAEGNAVPMCQMKPKITENGTKPLKISSGNFTTKGDFDLLYLLSNLKQKCLFGDLPPFNPKCGDRKRCDKAALDEETLGMNCTHPQKLEILSNGEWNSIKGLKCKADKWETEDSSVAVDALPQLRCATPLDAKKHSTLVPTTRANSVQSTTAAAFALGPGAIAGIAVGAFIVVIVLFAGIFYKKTAYVIAWLIKHPYVHQYSSVTLKYSEEKSDEQNDVYVGEVTVTNLDTRSGYLGVMTTMKGWVLLTDEDYIHIEKGKAGTMEFALKIGRGVSSEEKLHMSVLFGTLTKENTVFDDKPWNIKMKVLWIRHAYF